MSDPEIPQRHTHKLHTSSSASSTTVASGRLCIVVYSHSGNSGELSLSVEHNLITNSVGHNIPDEPPYVKYLKLTLNCSEVRKVNKCLDADLLGLFSHVICQIRV